MSVLPVRVYYADTDAGGVVYHATYLRFFEQGRVESLRQAGVELNVLFEKYGTMFVVKTITVRYIKPARLCDLLYIKTKVKELRKASLVYDQSIYLAESAGDIICSAEIKLACVNANMQPCVLPNILKKMESA